MNGYNVITIATATGAEAEETGRLLAEQLGFRSVNEQIIEWAAEQAGVSREAVDEVEHSQPLVTRIVEMLGSYPSYEMVPWLPDAVPYADPSLVYRGPIRAVIEQVAAEGEVVIVAHGAGMLLAGKPRVLRVFVTASPAVRARRVAAERGCSAREAEQIVQCTDRERAAYLRRLYGVRRELPTHYDLVVNSDALGPEQAAGVIAQAVGIETAQRV